jgi:2,4-dienoyl-CoA reductase (NADPH2)
VAKTAAGRADEINTCIACNQACLDHAFQRQKATCLVNPRAGRETSLVLERVPSHRSKRVAIIGAGPAGLAASVAAAERGHEVELFEAADDIGGQFQLARRIPGKEEFAETLRYFRRRLEVTGVKLNLNTSVDPERIVDGRYDAVVVATGVTPRVPDIDGIDHPTVVTYADVVSGRVEPGPRVAVVGAGGIGVDVAHFLTAAPGMTIEEFGRHWGVGDPAEHPGGVVQPERNGSMRAVFLVQRKTTRVGAGLGKTSGWAHRANLKKAGVESISGATYDRIDDDGLHLSFGPDRPRRILGVDQVVVCAGQEPERSLADALASHDVLVHVIGGADGAVELDAKHAIDQATRLAATL